MSLVPAGALARIADRSVSLLVSAVYAECSQAGHNLSAREIRSLREQLEHDLTDALERLVLPDREEAV
jgi:hypothetical protein